MSNFEMLLSAMRYVVLRAAAAAAAAAAVATTTTILQSGRKLKSRREGKNVSGTGHPIRGQTIVLWGMDGCETFQSNGVYVCTCVHGFRPILDRVVH